MEVLVLQNSSRVVCNNTGRDNFPQLTKLVNDYVSPIQANVNKNFFFGRNEIEIALNQADEETSRPSSFFPHRCFFC